MNARSLALLFLPLVPACDAGEASELGTGRLAAQVEDIGALIPTDAVAYFQVQSLEVLQQALDTLFEMADGAETPDARRFVGFALPGLDLEAVAADRPLGVAVSLPASSLSPALTLILPADDPETLRTANETVARSAAVEGGWVALSTAKDLDLTSARVALTRGLPAGVVSLRVDAETLIETYGPLIEGMLDSVEERAAAAPVEDLMVSMEWYFDLLRALIDSARTLEIGWGIVDGVMKSEGALHAKPGSALDGLFPEDPYLGEGRRFLIDEQSCLQAAYALDLRRALELWEPVLDSMLTTADDELRSGVTRFWSSWLSIAERAGKVVTFSADIGSESVCLLYGLEDEDPHALLEEIARALEEQGFAVERAGLQVADEDLPGLDVELTPAAVRNVLTSVMSGEGADPSLEEVEDEQIEDSLSRLEEYDFFARTLVREDHLLLALGMGEDGLVPRLERVFARADTPPPALAPLLRRIEGADAGAVVWLDLGRFAGGVSELVESFGRESELPRGLPQLPMSFHAAVDGPLYRWGSSIDLEGLGAFVKTLEESGGF